MPKSAETTCQRPAGVDQETKGKRLKHAARHSCNNTQMSPVSHCFCFFCLQSEASSKAVFAKVMVITSKRPHFNQSAKFK